MTLAALPAILLFGASLRQPIGREPYRVALLVAILGVLLLGGLIVSVKIGGGGDLHNLDAFLLLLLVVSGGSWAEWTRTSASPLRPARLLLLALVLLVPAGFAILSGQALQRIDVASQRAALADRKNTRTGNALLKNDLFKVGTMWFDPSFGSGGEDRDFFRRKIEQGCVFVWCNEAPVFETVPSKRWKRTVLLKRALLRGKMALNTREPRFMSLFNSVVAVAIYSCCLPVLLFLGHHVFMKYLIKDCDHLGKILASLGIDWVGEKYVGG